VTPTLGDGRAGQPARFVRRVLPGVWLVAAVPVGWLGFVVFAISETESSRRLGVILLGLAAVAVVTGGLLVVRPRDGVVRASLVVSLGWLAGAGYATATVGFATDRLLLGGSPAAVALITATLALKWLRDRRGSAAAGR
jgi:hypothetical protein